MILVILIIFYSAMLSALLAILGQSLYYKKTYDLEKSAAFECGFVKKDNFWSPFSMHFFLSALIFLIFDVEIVILFPFLMTSNFNMVMMSSYICFMFLVLLSMGFILEWSQSYLEWTK